MPNPFDELQPTDGYSVFEAGLGDQEAGIYLGMRMHGEIKEFLTLGDESSVEVWNRLKPKVEDLGDRRRALLLAEAVCRYFNTGGDWDELNSLLPTMGAVIKGGLVFPGWRFMDSYIDTDGNFTHVFVEEKGNKVVRWVEGQFVDTGLTLEDLQVEVEADGEIHNPTEGQRREDNADTESIADHCKILPWPEAKGE
jgi:hypothetical protein